MSGLYDGMMAVYFTGTNVEPAPEPVTTDTYFYVQDITGSTNTLYIVKENSSAPSLAIEYSMDEETWSSLGTTSTSSLTVQIPANGKVYLRCNCTAWATLDYNNKIYAANAFNVGGNILSLIYGSSFIGQTTMKNTYTYYVFKGIFTSSGVVDASNLLLPAERIAGYAYAFMFQYCQSLTKAPNLPATTIQGNCYNSMFKNCTSLTSVPSILPATTLQINCYQNMFSSCTSLTTAPELPAATLKNYSYANMFTGCSSLNYIKCLSTNISATSCTTDWVSGVPLTGTFVKDSTMTSWITGTGGIPTGWTVQDA